MFLEPLRSLLLGACILLANAAAAAGPASFRAQGIELGMTPAAVAAVLQRDYKPCGVDRTLFRAQEGKAPDVVAALAINPGYVRNDVGIPDFCTHSPEGDGVTDSIEARFLHPDIDPRQPLFALVYKRVYPDPVYGLAPVEKPFNALRNELVKLYGRPVDERRDGVASGASNLARSLGIANRVKREDQRVRYLWTARGALDDDEREHSTCRCDSRYVKAVIETTRAVVAGKAARTFSVLSVELSMADPVLVARQEEWNAQWLRERK